MASALKDVINAASGVSNFAVESARDLVQYFVRRGQMTQEEADKLLREAEEQSAKRGRLAPPRVDGAKKPALPPLVTKSVVPLTPPPRVVPPPKVMPVKAPPPKAAPAKAAPHKPAPAAKTHAKPAAKAKAPAPKPAKAKAAKKPAHKK